MPEFPFFIGLDALRSSQLGSSKANVTRQILHT